MKTGGRQRKRSASGETMKFYLMPENSHSCLKSINGNCCCCWEKEQRTRAKNEFRRREGIMKTRIMKAYLRVDCCSSSSIFQLFHASSHLLAPFFCSLHCALCAALNSSMHPSFRRRTTARSLPRGYHELRGGL